jgi:hypothetical protein
LVALGAEVAVETAIGASNAGASVVDDQ